jgi:hypothetical protein
MQPNKQLNRLFAALGREGLEVSREDRVYRVRRKQEGGPPAEVLLPDDFPVEAKALRQLAGLMAVRHPRVVRWSACAPRRTSIRATRAWRSDRSPSPRGW